MRHPLLVSKLLCIGFFEDTKLFSVRPNQRLLIFVMFYRNNLWL